MTEDNSDLPANKKKKEKERCNALMDKLTEVRIKESHTSSVIEVESVSANV